MGVEEVWWATPGWVLSCSVVSDSATPWTVTRQAPVSMGFSRQEYWSGLPFPSPEDLPDPGIQPASLTSPALASRFFSTSTTWEAPAVSQDRPVSPPVGIHTPVRSPPTHARVDLCCREPTADVMVCPFQSEVTNDTAASCLPSPLSSLWTLRSLSLGTASCHEVRCSPHWNE